MYWLAAQEDQTERAFIRRFTPRYWTVNFPRPMMASIVTTGVDSLKLDLTFYRAEDLCGLIWESEDLYDPPFLAYATSKDYSDTRLSFHWQSSGIQALDDLHGPTLTIEGRDEMGGARTWYVRLANYATGTGEDATVTLGFDDLDGGFILPSQADPVYPGDIDRMFISMVSPDYDAVTTGPLSSAVEASVTITNIIIEGGTSTLKTGDGYVKVHDLRIANGYDDVFNLTPERVIWNMIQMGHRDWITHYVGMSHYFNLTWDGGEERYIVDPAKAKLNVATQSWHQDYFDRAKFFGFKVIISLSYEIFAANAPSAWAQRAYDDTQALTGWVPPSTLVAPANQTALDYLRDVFLAFGALQAGDHYFQIGEPWWWSGLSDPGVPYFYDDMTTALYTSETGEPLPTKHQLTNEAADADQILYLDWLGDKLGSSTLWLRDQIKAVYSTAEVGLLFFSPQVLKEDAPMLERANFPAGEWASPAFDFFQIEDYDHVISGDWAAHAAAIEKIETELSYPKSASHYFAGFNLLSSTPEIWKNIDLAARDGFARKFSKVFLWAYPQVARDGFIYNKDQEQDMSGFHEIRFPLDISYGASGGPVYSTHIVEMASGHEQRNREWQAPKLSFDVGLGLRTEEDMAEILAFFRVRAGQAYGFRYRDWSDYESASPLLATDQVIGTGDAVTAAFQLVKNYQSGVETEVRKISKPVTGTVKVALEGGGADEWLAA